MDIDDHNDFLHGKKRKSPDERSDCPSSKRSDLTNLSDLSAITVDAEDNLNIFMNINYVKDFESTCKCEGVNLMCNEMLTQEEILNGVCPVCKKVNVELRRNALAAKLETNYDTIHLPAYNFKNMPDFISISYVQHNGKKFEIAHVPNDAVHCINICGNTIRNFEFIGSGRYGFVYKYNDECIKLVSGTEIELTAYISGKLKQQYPSEDVDAVKRCGLLYPNRVCTLHRTITYDAFQSTLQDFNNWNIDFIDNYYNIFCMLANAVRFLNLSCKISHYDINMSNIFINYTEGEIINCVLADYSLSEVHAPFHTHAGVASEVTKKIVTIDGHNNRLNEMYNPVSRPIVVQKDLLLNVNAKFDHKWNSQRYCNLELGALGNTILLCVLRMLCDNGVEQSKQLFENKLYGVVVDSYRINPIKDPDVYQSMCCKIMAYHILFNGLLFPELMITFFERVYDFLRSGGVDDLAMLLDSVFFFQLSYVKRRPIRTKYAILKGTESGRKIITDLKQLIFMFEDHDLNHNPFRIFANRNGGMYN